MNTGRQAPHAELSGTAKERVQKVLARAGLGARRRIDRSIADGKVRVNGRVCPPGRLLRAGDRLTYNDQHYRVVRQTTSFETLLYNKPVGEVTTRHDPQGRKTVFDRLPDPARGRWIAIGRLDINTSGLLILTTDGELANAMMHPSGGVDREYACRIHGRVTEEQLQRLRAGVRLADGMARFSDIAAAGAGATNRWFQVTLMEGRRHEVRRLWASQGVEVSRLQRVRYGAVFLPKGLGRGRWRRLESRDHRILREDVGLAPVVQELTLQRETRASSEKRRPKARAPAGLGNRRR